jgi:L-alanine-DL-glutamate epimerase-like enolase superfamily enzyme
MPDLERIGGVTGWQRAAALAAVNRIKMSSHLYPELSAHLLAASPTCHFLEYVDWADAIVEEPLEIIDGCAAAPPAGQWADVECEGGRAISHLLRRAGRAKAASPPSITPTRFGCL